MYTKLRKHEADRGADALVDRADGLYRLAGDRAEWDDYYLVTPDGAVSGVFDPVEKRWVVPAGTLRLRAGIR